MNPTPAPFHDRLEELLEAHFQGNLSAAGKAEFAALLDGSDEARRRFVELAGFESALTGIQHSLPAATVEPIRLSSARSRRLRPEHHCQTGRSREPGQRDPQPASARGR